MGAPLGPYLTNIFLSFHEITWLENCPLVSNQFTIAGMSVTVFCYFAQPNILIYFLLFLNQQHANKKFTTEIETFNKTLSFLDIQIKRSNSSFTTSVYQKPTFTGLFTNFHSFIPLKYKKRFNSDIFFPVF